MAASNPPKGSVSSSSIKPVTRKAVRCQREVAWLVTQAAGRLVATTEDVNAPTPSFVLAAALERVHQLEQAAQEAVREREARARAEAQTASAKPGKLVVRSADEFEY